MPTHVRTLTSAAAAAIVTVVMLPGVSDAVQTQRAAAATPVPTDSKTDVSAPALSYSGRYVAYLALRRGGAPAKQQLRRADLTNGTSVLLTPSIDGGAADGNYSRPPTISADGSRAGFASFATRLVADDTNGRNDAFVRDVPGHSTLLASGGLGGNPANGDTGMASLSKNGRYVAFTSDATNVVAGSTTTNSDVYLRDLQTNTTVQVSVRPDGSPSKGPGSNTADVSADGELVAFADYDTDLVTNDDNDTDADLYVRNMVTGKTRWISAGLPAGASPSGVVISPDGKWVSSRWADGSLHLTRVSSGATSTVTADGYAFLGSFSSALGRFVFMSSGQPYVRDLATGTDTAIPVPAGGSASSVTVSGNGAYAAFDWFPADGTASGIFRVSL